MSNAAQLVDDQVRLILKQQCAKLFRVLMSALPPGAAATLLFIDYGEPPGGGRA